MKKFFKSMALSLVVAVFAICCLAGCGSKDEFKDGANATAAEIYEIASTANNEFGAGYSMYMVAKVGKQKAMEIDLKLIVGEDDIQVAMVMGMANNAGGYDEIEAYITDGYAYENYDGLKVKEVYDTEDVASEIAGAFQKANISETLLYSLDRYADREAQGFGFKIKKLVDEETGLERFKIYDDVQNSYLIVGYLDGQIVEYVTEMKAKGVYMYTSIKVLPADATIEFPADLDTYTEAV